MSIRNDQPLSGLKVVEIGGGAAAAYCGRLLVDAGAAVTLVADAERPWAGYVRGDGATETLYAHYLTAGKPVFDGKTGGHSIESLCRDADLVLVGEDAGFDPLSVSARLGVVDISWFGERGPYSAWKGLDIVVEALTGIPHLAGDAEGPPIHSGDRHATLVAGATAYLACMVAILSRRAVRERRFTVNILEANMILSEMDIHLVEHNGEPLKRYGVNRFSPNGPVGIYPCKDGWIGILAFTPEQWLSLFKTLEMDDLAADTGLATRELRSLRMNEIEEAMVKALAGRTPEEWAERGRNNRVPMVVVPDAKGILSHPVFRFRQSLAMLKLGADEYRVPRTPFGLTRTPSATEIIESSSPARPGGAGAFAGTSAGTEDTSTLLEDVTVVDFSMGWAGPLTSRFMADFGATVLKIEAGRYPDWWRSVNLSADYIADKGYEKACGYCALNRGKQGTSLDLTTQEGRRLALALVAGADAVVENQAAGVMRKLGLGYEAMADVNPEIVVLSMSAFGADNTWSDTRAYGSTMEQGSGLPNFTGFEDKPPTMAHLAYGDPVGGLFGCAALLTALVYRKRTGKGQWINLSMIESMLQLTTPSLLHYQLTGEEPPRPGNRHPVFSPHGIFPCAGEDQWVALGVTDAASFAVLARTIGRDDLAGDATLSSADERRARQDEIEAAISAWTRACTPGGAACTLQAVGVAAAPVLHTEEIVGNGHFEDSGFFMDLEREVSGPQRQCGIGITQDGKRLGARNPAPLMGEHTKAVLSRFASVDGATFDDLVGDGVISFVPTASHAKILKTQAPAAGKDA
ncbi:crotonobetainyl-CoA:carnitine CoA-transferase CaiB-like acyl-CoA transferase [Bradyrhizobium sp. USDA 4509]